MLRSTSNRRQFLRTASGLTAAGGMVPYWLTGEAARANEFKAKNDRPHIGAIGVGGRGSGITRQAARFGEVVAVCDVDRKHAERVKASYDGRPDVYEDYRKLLDRNDVEVIINGTPDHWHTIINLAACRAGKDIYTEKPLTLTIDEGKILSEVWTGPAALSRSARSSGAWRTSAWLANWSATAAWASSST